MQKTNNLITLHNIEDMENILERKGNNHLYLTDGGLETTLVFHKHIDLPHFAAFDLLERPDHREELADYFKGYLQLARQFDMAFILESPTWRASKDWGFRMGYSEQEIFDLNRKSIHFLRDISSEFTDIPALLYSGCIGPRGDGYTADGKMSAEEACNYHLHQVEAFRAADADMVSGITINYLSEALGIVQAAMQTNMPAVISFTVETDGKLPSGETLGEAITSIDSATDGYPEYYMINCAHPTHFLHVLQTSEEWPSRIMGIRANASCKSHEELDESTELDTGDRKLLARGYQQLQQLLPNLFVYGGCCGTDTSHIRTILEACIVQDVHK